MNKDWRDPEFRIPEETTVSDDLTRRDNMNDAVEAFDPTGMTSVDGLSNKQVTAILAVIAGIVIVGAMFLPA